MFLSALCVEELMILFIDKKLHETRILTFDRIYITQKKYETNKHIFFSHYYLCKVIT